MNVDFHFHTCLAKAIPFEPGFFRQAVERAQQQQISAILITDHFDNHNFAGIFTALDRDYPYNGHYYLAGGVRFYPGIEVAIREGPHLLFSAPREQVIEFAARLQPHLTRENYCTLADFFAYQAGMNGLCVFAHPGREKREIERVDPALLSGFQALDLNAKDLWYFGSQHREVIEQLGTKHNLPLVTGSDTHHYRQLGSVSTRFDSPFESIIDLRRLIQSGAGIIQIHPDLALNVETAQELKREIKTAFLQRSDLA